MKENTQQQPKELQPFIHYRAIKINGKTYPLKTIIALSEVQKIEQIYPEFIKDIKENFHIIWQDLDKTEMGKERKKEIEEFSKDFNVPLEISIAVFEYLFRLEIKKDKVIKQVQKEKIYMDIIDLMTNIEILTEANNINNIAIITPIKEAEELTEENYKFNPVNLIKTLEVY